MRHSSLDLLIAECVSDRAAQKHLKKIVTQGRKANRKEQRPLSDAAITAILVKSIQAEDRGWSKEMVMERVHAIMAKSLRPFEGAILTERSPTARDLIRDHRKQAVANLKKYR